MNFQLLFIICAYILICFLFFFKIRKANIPPVVVVDTEVDFAISHRYIIWESIINNEMLTRCCNNYKGNNTSYKKN
jgi:hypothetical protein